MIPTPDGGRRGTEGFLSAGAAGGFMPGGITGAGAAESSAGAAIVLVAQMP